MKDYLGHELRVGDLVVTFVQTNTGGTELITAEIERLTRTRVWLHKWNVQEYFLQKTYTLPDKCIRVFRE